MSNKVKIMTIGLVVSCAVGISLVAAGHGADVPVTASVADADRSGLSILTGLASLIAAFGSLIGYRSDVPWYSTNKGDLWTERQMKRASDYIGRGSGDWSKLGRTLLMVPAIAALGPLFYAEDNFRNLGFLDAARWGSQ